VARKSGEAVGSGLRKISKVPREFAAGVSKELRPRKSSSEGSGGSSKGQSGRKPPRPR
jgi:hypothetical protein